MKHKAVRRRKPVIASENRNFVMEHEIKTLFIVIASVLSFCEPQVLFSINLTAEESSEDFQPMIIMPMLLKKGRKRFH